MALKPKISVSLNNKCNKITIVEETGPFVITSNEGGWGFPNGDTAGIANADVQFFNSNQTPAVLASGTGSISGTTFTDTTHISGTFAIGQTLTGAGVAAGTTITALITGTGANNGGTYEISIAQTVASTTISGNLITQNYILKDSSVDVYAGVSGAPTPGRFTALSEVPWSGTDGIFQIVYTIENNKGQTFTNDTQYQLFLCNLCNCKNALITMLIDACDVKTVKKLKTEVDQMEIYIYGIETAFACGDFDTAEAILTAATTYCNTIKGCASNC